MQLISSSWGGLNAKSPGSSVLTPLTIPSGVSRRGFRTTFSRHRRTSILNGRFDPSLAWYDHVGLLRKGGMPGPSSAISATVSNGGHNITANSIYYITWIEKSGAYELAESSTSPESPTYALVAGQATLTIPATASNARTTHVGIYRSDDGDIPSRVTVVTLGTTSYVDNIASGARGLEVPVFSDGAVIPSSRDPVPFCRFSFGYQRRCWYAGDPAQPQRLYPSILNEPEAVPPQGYQDTPLREAITAIGKFGDSVLVFGHNVIYGVQGYDIDDFVLRELVHGIGCISHHSIDYDPWGRLWFVAQDGIYMYDGTLRKMSVDIDYFWKEDYKLRPDVYADSVGLIDNYWKVYRLLLPNPNGSTDKTTFYIGAWPHLDPAQMGSVAASSMQPAWSFDVFARRVTAQGILVESGDRKEVFTGDGDGVLYQDNVAANGDDAGDLYYKQYLIRTGGIIPGNQTSGGHLRGSKLTSLTLYIWSNGTYVQRIWSGTDKVLAATNPTWGPHTFPANATLAAKTDEVEKFMRPTRCSGKIHVLETRGTLQKSSDVEWRGYSLDVAPSVQSRSVRP